MSPLQLQQLFGYFGSKARMVNTLYELVPENTRVLVSLFMGSGVFEYNYALTHPRCKVVCYDMDPAVVNFHRQALADRVRLHAKVMATHAALCRAQGPSCDPMIDRETYARLLAKHRATKEPVSMADAARFYVITSYSFNGKFGSFARKPFREPRGLLNVLPTNLEVRQGDALEVLDQMAMRSTKGAATTCVYLDPPYFIPGNNYYTHARLDHERMAASLLRLAERGVQWVLSYNDVPEVRQMYRAPPGARIKPTMVNLPVAYRYVLSTSSVLTPKAELIVTTRSLTPAQRRHVRATFHRDQPNSLRARAPSPPRQA